MIPRAEVSGDSVAFARNTSSPEYATQLLSRKVFDNGTTEETYATTAVFTARTNTGSGSTSDNPFFTSYTLYATISIPIVMMILELMSVSSSPARNIVYPTVRTQERPIKWL